MSTVAAAPGWRQYTFFDVVPVKDTLDLANPPEILRNPAELSAIISSFIGVIYADVHGNVHILDATIQSIRTWVAHVGGRVTHLAENRGILVTLGEEDSTRLPLLKIWDLEHADKKTGYPALLRSIKVQNSGRPHPISTVALSSSLSHLAIGIGDGTVLLFRHLDQSLFSGSTSLTALPKPKIIHESPNEPITGLGFREPQASNDSFEKTDGNLYLFIVTTNRVLSYLAAGKGSGAAPTEVDEVGCGLGCAVMDKRTRQMVVARDEAIYMCGADGRGACYAYEGPKSYVYAHKTYLIIVSPPFYPTPTNASATVRNYVARAADPTISQRDISKVTIVDIENKFVAYSGPFKEGVREVFCQWDRVFILTNDGKLSRLDEKSTTTKLDILFRQSRYPLAISLARTQGVDEATIADIHRQYGDHLYLKADYDTAMQQFVKTLGYLQPSYVIRKFLDAQRIHNLTTYLQELHTKGLANSDHTTLLLNTYTKLKDVTRLDSFIKTESLRGSGTSDSKAGELPFDLDTAIRVCRQAGYFDHAAYLARKYERHEDFLRIQIEDLGHYGEALVYLKELGPDAAESSLARYGRPLLLALPNEMTDMLIDLCAGSPPTSDSPDQEDATAVPSKSGGPSYLSYLAYNKGSLPLTLDSAPPATPVTTTSTTTAVPQDFTPGHQRGASSNRRSHFDGESSRASSPPLGNAPAPRRTPARKRPSPRQYFAHFVDHPKNFQQFLEAIALRRWRLSVGEDLNPSISQQIPDASAVAGDNDKDDQTAVWNTLLELYLSQRALQSEEADSSILLQQKAMAILERDSIFHYDPMHALIVCTTRDFTSGLVLLWEKMGMYEDILRFWMEKENSGELHDDSITQNQPSHQVLSHLDKYGPAHPHLYTLVLRFLTSTPALLSRHTPDVMRILGRIDQDKIIPPLGVIQILSRNGVASVGLVKEWLMTRISESREEINADRHLVSSYRSETKAKLQEVAELSDPDHPRVFHVTRCSSCGGQLDLPSVHFMCKHSYHQKCLADNETECPNCAQSHGVIREIKRDNDLFADQHDLFLHNVNDGGFDAIAQGFSRGLLSSKIDSTM